MLPYFSELTSPPPILDRQNQSSKCRCQGSPQSPQEDTERRQLRLFSFSPCILRTFKQLESTSPWPQIGSLLFPLPDIFADEPSDSTTTGPFMVSKFLELQIEPSQEPVEEISMHTSLENNRGDLELYIDPQPPATQRFFRDLPAPEPSHCRAVVPRVPQEIPPRATHTTYDRTFNIPRS